MKPIQLTSLRRKLILVIMAAAGLTLLMAVAAFLGMEARNFRRSAHRELQILAEVVGEGSAAAIEFRDPAEAERLLSALRAHRHITDAAILDRQGQVLASYRRPGAEPGPPPAQLPQDAFRFQDGHLWLTSSIRHSGEEFGTIYLREDLEELTAYVGWMVGAVLLVSLLIGTAATLLAIRMGRLVVEPVLHLTEAARRIAKHQTPGERVLRETQDEVGLLVDAFNEMLDQLGERQARLEEAQHLAHLGNWVRDPDAGRSSWSDETFRIFGLEPSTEMPAFEQVRQFIHPDDLPPLEAAHARSLQDGSQFAMELRIRRPDGPQAWIHVLGARFTDSSGRRPVLRGTIMDITERKRAEAAMLPGQKLERLGVLAGGIAHDFNNFLMAIQGYIDLCRLELPEGSRPAESLLKAGQVLVRAADLTRQMLAYSGKAQFHSRPLDLCHLVRELIHLLSVSISKKAELRVEIADDLPAVVGDPAQLQQVVMNLVINASDAIQGQDGTIRIAAQVERLDQADLDARFPGQAMEPGLFVVLTVQDNGQGMEPRTLARIFDPFFTTKFQGRGLGLAALLGIVKAHKGGIKVQSERGRGTTFKVLLPASGEPARRPAPETGGERYRSSGLVVLVEDEADIRAATSEYLRKIGFEVIQAADGRAGVERVRENLERVRMVLLDYTMPHMDGAECFRLLQAMAPALPVLMTSGFGEGVSTQALDGLAGFIQKPYTLSRLRAKMQEVLG
ncbi:MAG: CHASE sensor domain-containing protein [Holophaga sp.]|nr:CHASE sensor domain-containing protein [Holophaga sp.]